MSPTFDELMVLYVNGPSSEKRSHERDLYSLKWFAPFLGGRELASLTVADVRCYIAQRQTDGASAATINKEVGMFRAALNWAGKELEWNILNPFEGRKLKEPPGRGRWLTQSEASALIRAADEGTEILAPGGLCSPGALYRDETWGNSQFGVEPGRPVTEPDLPWR